MFRSYIFIFLSYNFDWLNIPSNCDIQSNMIIKEYDRVKAVEYAKTWALGRNPRYFDFNDLGGDCTNYASQCLYAGSGVMNFTPVLGWYYINASERTASWTGVEYFYNFIVGNKDGNGPFGREVELDDVKLGDFIQLGRATGDFYHTPIVTGFRRGNTLVCAHTYDALDRPLATYSYEKIRCIHIEGVRYKEK